MTKGWSDQEVNTEYDRDQPINYKAKFLQRDNICLVDFKYNITYQNVRGETNVRPIFIP